MERIMRIVILTAMGLTAACGRGGAASDSTVVKDTITVAGPPAVPTVQAPPPPEQKASNPPAAQPTSAAASKTAAAAPASDSIRGTVSVTGTSFEKHVMVAEPGTHRRLEIIGPLATTIGRVAGTEVTVSGSLSGAQLEAKQFVVRVADGKPAIDGMLKTEGGSLFIVAADGMRTRIVAPPPPLVGKDGARVWITGDPAKGIASFGIIDPAR
jgi:hypothetical protein